MFPLLHRAPDKAFRNEKRRYSRRSPCMGAIGHEHNLAVQNTVGLEFLAACDTNPERVTAALQLAPEATTFSNATEMLNSGLLDLVVISTPPNSHYEWSKESPQRGIHVVLEKPMVLTADQCDELFAIKCRGIRWCNVSSYPATSINLSTVSRFGDLRPRSAVLPA